MARRRVLIPVKPIYGKPSAPLLSGSVTAQGSVSLSWSSVTPPQGFSIANYKVYRNGVLYDTVTGSTLSKSYSGLADGIVHNFTVTAVTNVGIESQESNAVGLAWPYWDGTALVVYVTQGTAATIDAKAHALHPVVGQQLTFGRSGRAGDTAPASVTVNQTTGIITSPSTLAAGDYAGEIYDDDGVTTGQTDWQNRANQAGVVWAQSFATGDSSGDYWMRQGESSTAVCRRLSTDGILNNGCLEIFIPQGQTPGNAGWGRPLAPVQAYPAFGIAADNNPKGLPALPMQNFFSYQGDEGYKKLSNMRGGCFGNAAYFDSTQYYPGVPEFVWSGTFWLQFRVKINSNRMLASEHAGKLFILDHNSGGTAMGELVQGINADRWSAWPRGMYWYTAQGRQELTNPQGNPGNYLPGSAYTSCNYPPTSANCWSMPIDTWVTFNVGMTPGRQSVTTPGPDFGYVFTTKYYDAGLVVKVAAQGDTAWTTLINKSDFWWWYDAQFNNTIPAQWGWAGQQCPNAFNEIRFSQYNGGGQQFVVNNDISVKLDQIICSTVEPALPLV